MYLYRKRTPFTYLLLVKTLKKVTYDTNKIVKNHRCVRYKLTNRKSRVLTNSLAMKNIFQKVTQFLNCPLSRIAQRNENNKKKSRTGKLL